MLDDIFSSTISSIEISNDLYTYYNLRGAMQSEVIPLYSQPNSQQIIKRLEILEKLSDEKKLLLLIEE